jgi:VWFA-related protein
MSISIRFNIAVRKVLPVVCFFGIGLGPALGQSASVAKANPDPSGDANTPDTDQPALTMSVKVKVVNLLATVRDKHGKIATGLGKDDFTLTEDGRPQTIRYFAKETDLPLTLGLLVDTSGSQRRVLEQEKIASHAFLNEMMRVDKDKAFLIHFDREVELLQDLTSLPEKLEGKLDELEIPEYGHGYGGSGGNYPGGGSGGGQGHGSGGGHRGHGGGTLLYDAVFLASDELMSKQEGRKALVILTDGVDDGSQETLDYAVETAQRADTVVYSILFKDDEGFGNFGGGFGGPWGGHGGGMGRHGGGMPQEHADGKKVLERISRETGGRMFQVSKKEPIDQIYAQIGEELRNQYSLGYTPDRAGTLDASYHKIQLTTKQKDLIVQTRDGYYGGQ